MVRLEESRRSNTDVEWDWFFFNEPSQNVGIPNFLYPCKLQRHIKIPKFKAWIMIPQICVCVRARVHYIKSPNPVNLNLPHLISRRHEWLMAGRRRCQVSTVVFPARRSCANADKSSAAFFVCSYRTVAASWTARGRRREQAALVCAGTLLIFFRECGRIVL